jgi:chaperonin GroES
MTKANTSGIFPTEYKVLIEPVEIAAKTKGGIILPEEHKDREQFAQMQGTLVAVSKLAFTYASNDEWAPADRPKVGDKVLYAKYAGAKVTGMDGKDYRIVNDKDIAAVLS